MEISNITPPIVHLYGVIIGLAIMVGVYLVELQAQKQQIHLRGFNSLIWLTLFCGVIGARLYHVGSDFYLYQHNLWGVFKIWEGGLSIIGAVLGAIAGLWSWTKIDLQLNRNLSQSQKKTSLLLFLDLAIFGLPIAQAIGRVGNYFNQELYGLPTTLPWGMYIQPEKRLLGFENFAYFQPLFFYEIFFLLLFGGGLWWLVKQKQASKHKQASGFNLGSGQLFSLYIFYYSFIRFWLDFIRIDKTQFFNTFLGNNQVFLLGVMMIVGIYWLRKNKKR